MDRLAYPKPVTVKDDEYLKFIRSCRCLVGNISQGIIAEKYRCFGTVSPHHTQGRKRDDKVIPLCFNHHRMIHDLPKDKWLEAIPLDKAHFEDSADSFREKYKELCKEL